MAKAVIYLLMFLLIIGIASAQCIEPTDGMLISASSVTFCEGDYFLPNGIVIGKSGIELNCNGARLEGVLKGKGIDVKDFDELRIGNCVVDGYEYGLYFEGSDNNFVTNIEVKNSRFGVYLHDSNVTLTEMTYTNVEDEVYDSFDKAEDVYIEVTEDMKPKDTVVEKEEIVVKDKSSGEEFDNVVDMDIVDELGLRSGYERAKEKVIVGRKKVVGENSVEYEIRVTPKEDVHDLKVYEIIPKELVSHSYLIESSHDFEVVKEDPVIVFRLGDVKEGEEKAIMYEISKPELTAVNPFSVASIERFVNPTDSKIIRIMFGLALILFLVNSFIRGEIKEKTGEE